MRVVFLIFVPFLTALIYLVARGNSMADRNATEAARFRRETDAHITDVAGAKSPTDEIARAAELHQAGTSPGRNSIS